VMASTYTKGNKTKKIKKRGFKAPHLLILNDGAQLCLEATKKNGGAKLC
jgi:hypothetical protein